MADDTSPSKSGAFFTWLGGIVASVLTAVLIYHFTQSPPPPPPPPTIPPIGLSGIVVDAATHTLIHDAVVTVKLGDQSVQQSTDPLGAYSVVLPGIGTTETMGTISTTAHGYAPYSNSVPLKPGDGNFASINIEALTPPPTQPTTTGTPVIINPAALHAGIILNKPPANFIKPITKYAPSLKP